MSYNRGKKKFKKNKQNGNNLSPYERILKMFGNPNMDILHFKGKGTCSTDESFELHKSGEREFGKIINSFKKPYVLDKLIKIKSLDLKYYDSILKVFVVGPYVTYGNKFKSWFNEFYEFVSKLPINDGDGNEETFIPLYRVMYKSEFHKMLKEGVQNPSWSIDIKNNPRFIKSNLLSNPSEEVVCVYSLFKTEQILHLSVGKDEGEQWVRKGSIPHKTWVLGEYNYSQFKTGFVDTDFENLRKIQIGTNGYGTDEIGDNWGNVSGSHDDINYKFLTMDIPKLSRKVSKDKDIEGSPLQDFMMDTLDKFCESDFQKHVKKTLKPVLV